MLDSVIAQIKQLLATPEPPRLGLERRAGVMSETALNTKLDSLFRDSKLSPVRQQLIRSLLLLWHDHLDASHNISQGIETLDGSFVHAIMHRRERDYGNAKYWWRRVGAHPGFPEIARRVGKLPAGSRRREEADLAKQLAPGGYWDANAFVDLCEQAATSPRNLDVLREIQRIETEVLLERFLSGNPAE